jgi:diamine N-acetyltransferase
MSGASTQPRIRRATPEDVPRLKELGVLGWETTYQHIVRPENRTLYLAGPFWSLETLERIVRDPACIVLVAEDDAGTVTGFLSVEPLPDDVVELTRFYVDPSCRRSGIGQALFDAALALVPPTSRTMIVNVFADNDVGCAFYERAGFRLHRLEPFQIGDQSVRDAWYEREIGAG